MTVAGMRLRDHILPVGKRTCIMGILNVTPDSFSDGGRYINQVEAVEHARHMEAAGADIIDIGGESSRPGSAPVSSEEELNRVMPVIRDLKGKISIPMSIDTCKSEVARPALVEGVALVNDITALRGDRKMAGTIAEFNAGVVLMHMQGGPQVMQDAPGYDDLISEILSYLSDSIDLAVKSGIKPDRIIVDPGIGFGKTVKHNLAILQELRRFKQFGKPVLVGTSRKAFIGEVTGKEADNRIFGTAASFTAAISNGADMIRVHDVGEMRDVALLTDAITGA